MLLLDSFIFSDFEIPPNVKGLLSGKQMLAIKKQIGGQRTIDAMGPDPKDITWSGRFQGGNLTLRASQLAAIRDAGQAVALTCDLISLTVVVAEFDVSYERAWQGTYDIRLVVQPDITDDNTDTLDDLVGSDMGSANQIAAGGVTGGTMTQAQLAAQTQAASSNVSSGAAGL